MKTRINIKPLVFILTITLILCLFFTSFGNTFLIKINSPLQKAEAASYPAPKITKLIYPTFGQPVIQKKGASFTFKFDFTEGGSQSQPSLVKDWQASLISSNEPFPATYLLNITTANFLSPLWQVGAAIPGNVAEDLYNLKISVNADGVIKEDTQINAVKVVNEFKDNFTFVQLTDTHVGDFIRTGGNTTEVNYADPDPTKRWLYMRKAMKELSFIHPEFAIISGDLTFGWNYLTEYPEAYDVYKNFDIPVFMIPGNHDDYSNDFSSTGIDGRKVWQKYFSPLNYSFDYGDYHFTAVNSHDWVDRPVTVSNGQLTTDTLNWIESDLSAHQNSKIRFIFMHHNPLHPGSTWTGTGSSEVIDLIKNYNVKMALFGHTHDDEVIIQDGTIYATTNSADMDTRTYPGFRLIKINGSNISSYNYTEPQYSVPTYKNSYPGVSIPTLHQPSLDYSFSPANDGTNKTVTCKIDNYYSFHIDQGYLEFYLPKLESGLSYLISGGTIEQTWESQNNVTAVVGTSVPAQSSAEVTIKPSATPSPPPPPVIRSLSRLAGQTRYQTAVEISKKGWTNSDVVILARGDDFPDALSAVPLAVKYKAPILLTYPDFLNSSTLDEIKRLKTKEVIALGLAQAISPEVIGSLEKEAQIENKNIHRLGGLDRYQTAACIAEWLNKTSNKAIFVATGKDYPDSLSCGSIAGLEQMPIILADENHLIKDTQMEKIIKDLNIEKAYILGTEDVVSKNIEDSLKSAPYNLKQVLRLGGETRYETARLVADFGLSCGLGTDYLCLATGENFPDALTIGPLAGMHRSPQLIVTKTNIPEKIENFVTTHSQNINNAYLAGGSDVVSGDVMAKIKKDLGL